MRQMKKDKISEQELEFVHEYVSNGFKGRQAYEVAFKLSEKDIEDKKGYYGSYRLLKRQIVQDAIDMEEGSYKAKAREIDMSREDILQELKEIIWGKRTIVTKEGAKVDIGEDGKTKIAAINTLVKLTGDFSPEKKEIDFTQEKKLDTKNMSEEELKALQATLMNEM